MTRKQETRCRGEFGDLHGNGPKSGGVPFADTSTNQDTINVYNRAIGYAKRNPDVMSRYFEYGLSCIERNQRISTQRFFEEVRAVDKTDNAGGDAFKLDNNWFAVFSRLLVSKHPECRARIVLRKSRFDELMGGGLDG